MKILLRLCFISLIVFGLASQYAAGREGVIAADAQGRLFSGLKQLDLHIDRRNTDNVFTARSPSCEAPIQLALSRIDGADDDTLAQFRSPSGSVRYIYLGSVAAKRSQSSILLRWLQAHVLFVLGLRPLDAPSQLVFVALPGACPDLAALPWSALSPRS
jgi:hypothetical protein